MSLRVRLLAAVSVSALLLASCGGGGDSSGRTKNSALCYATQEEKDAAVQAARDAFDAAMSGAPSEDAPEETPTTIEEETPTTISEDTSTTLEEAGSGYRRPAVRFASDGDTSTTVEVQSDEGDGGEIALTPEQQQAQMDLEAAESQPLCESDSESAEISCTATRTVDGVTDDCADGDVRVEDSNGGEWTLVNTAEDGTETVLAQGTYDVTTVGLDTPVIIPITYTLPGSGDSEGSSDNCTATFTSTGVSWNCPNGELFNAAIEDMSNPGVYPLVECAASGSFTVAENQQFWFNFSLGATFFDGYNNHQEQNVAIEFTVPEDSDRVCSGGDVEDINWDELPYSGASDSQTDVYTFTVPADSTTPVYVRFSSADDFYVYIDEAQNFSIYPFQCEEGCETFIGYSIWDLEPGDYEIELYSYENSSISWSSSVEISANLISYPTLPFTYTSDGSKAMYTFVLEESQEVTLAATANQTCTASQDDREGNGFVDPELEIRGTGGFSESDDNSGRGPGNCSASLLSLTLEPGRYSVIVEDDDHEGGSIVLGSNVELEQPTLTWNLTSIKVIPDSALVIDVPAGGAWFRASTVINETVTWRYQENKMSEPISIEGCPNPDGDVNTYDGNCPDSFLALFDKDGIEFMADDDGGMQSTSSRSNGVVTIVETNHYASDLVVFLEEGTYTLAIMECCGPLDDGVTSSESYELNFGFGTEDQTKAPVIEPKVDENPEIPQTVEQAKIPGSQLSVNGASSTSIGDGVESMVCDASCIDAMFASAGISDGSIRLTAGAESVILRKGQKSAVIPIGKNAGEISAVVTSSDGTKVVSLSSGISKISDEIQSAIDSKVAIESPSKSGSSMVLYLVGILVVLIGAGVVVARKKKTT